MDTLIYENGKLRITPETSTESYALRKWLEKNIEEDSHSINANNIVFRFGTFDYVFPSGQKTCVVCGHGVKSTE